MTTPLSGMGLVHGAGNRVAERPDTAEVTPEWVRATRVLVRRVVADGVADRERLLAAEAAMADDPVDDGETRRQARETPRAWMLRRREALGVGIIR
jgi:hypothetical protein